MGRHASLARTFTGLASGADGEGCWETQPVSSQAEGVEGSLWGI